MYTELKENRPHGTKSYPYTQYHMSKMNTPFQIPVHWHDELEIIYIEKGVLNVSINGQLYEGNAGSVFIVNQKDLHFMGSYDSDVDYFAILFPLEFISFRTDDSLETELLQPLRNGLLIFNSYINTKYLSNNMLCILKDIININRNKNSNYELKTHILLLEFLFELLEMTDMIKPADSKLGSSLQRDIISYIQDNFTNKITLLDIATEFHMSEKYFSRYFKKHFHISFSRYVSHMRLTHAKKLLETTDFPVTDIAFMSGFLSVSYFIRSFKEEYGKPPLTFRK